MHSSVHLSSGMNSLVLPPKQNREERSRRSTGVHQDPGGPRAMFRALGLGFLSLGDASHLTSSLEVKVGLVGQMQRFTDSPRGRRWTRAELTTVQPKKMSNPASPAKGSTDGLILVKLA